MNKYDPNCDMCHGTGKVRDFTLYDDFEEHPCPKCLMGEKFDEQTKK